MKRYEDVTPEGEIDLCRFCHPRKSETILYEDENFYVMPSRGQFTEGYLLLLSKEHQDSVADVVTDQFVTIKSALGELLRDEYGSACFFEHGRTGSCYQRADNRICYHAHLHCLPIPSDFTDRVAEDFSAHPIDSIYELPTLRDDISVRYLYVEPAPGRGRYFNIDSQIERQYLRKRACEALNLPPGAADWKTHPFKNRMRRTVETLDGQITEYIETLKRKSVQIPA